MKKRLSRFLLLVVGLVVGLPELFAAQTPQNNGVYYLYNETTGLFMSRGATWGTRATADYYGVPIKVVPSDDYHILTAVDRDVNGYGGKYWMYSDEGDGNARVLQIIEASNGNYKLRVNTWGDASQFVYINSDGDEGYKNLLAGNSGDQSGLAEGMYLWKFLSQAERDEIIANRVDANNVALADKIGYEVASTAELEALIGDANQFV